MLKVRFGIVYFFLFRPVFSFECGVPVRVPSDTVATRLLTAMGDSSVAVRRKASQELKLHADSLGKDTELYDSLVVYSLENLFTHYYLKFNEGFDWFNKFQAQEMPAICRRFKSESSFEFRRALLLSLERKKHPLAGQILRAGFNDTDSTVVVESIRIYGKNGFDDSFMTLTSFLDSGSLLEKVGAIRGLRYYEDTSTVNLLLAKVLRKKNQDLPHDFSLVPVNLMSVSAVYIIDTTTPNRGASLHDEAFCSIEEIMGSPTEKKLGRVMEWLRKRSGKTPAGSKRKPKSKSSP